MRKMGGLREEDPEHLLDDAHRRDRDRRASRRSPASSARTRSSARRSSSASSGSGRSAIVVAVMTAFYMFRLIGLTFWGESRVDPAVEPKIHESPRGDDDAALAPRDPVGPPRARPVVARAAARAALRHRGPGPARRLARAVFEQGEELLGHAEAAFQLVRHRRRPDRRQRRRRRRSACSPPGGCSASSSARSAAPARPGARPRADAPACRSCTAPRSTSGGSTTSTTCCSSSSAAGSRTFLWWFDRQRRRRHRQRHRRADRRRRPRPRAGSRPAASRTTRWASPSG